jgi:hypothetical protein
MILTECLFLFTHGYMDLTYEHGFGIWIWIWHMDMDLAYGYGLDLCQGQCLDTGAGMLVLVPRPQQVCVSLF